MTNLEKRIAQLERAQAVVNLKAMTNDELIAYADTLESGSPGWYKVIIERVMRSPNNRLKVVAHPRQVMNEKS